MWLGPGSFAGWRKRSGDEGVTCWDEHWDTSADPGMWPHLQTLCGVLWGQDIFLTDSWLVMLPEAGAFHLWLYGESPEAGGLLIPTHTAHPQH